MVSLARSSYAGYEKVDGIEVCVQLQQGVMEGVNATVQLTTQSGTASEGVGLHHYIALSDILFSLSLSLRSAADDYESVDVLITFDDMSPLGTSHCVDITITNDNITEPEETFSVTLIPVSDFVTFGIESASLDIHDDDGKSIHILLLDQTFRQFMLIP